MTGGSPGPGQPEKARTGRFVRKRAKHTEPDRFHWRVAVGPVGPAGPVRVSKHWESEAENWYRELNPRELDFSVFFRKLK